MGWKVIQENFYVGIQIFQDAARNNTIQNKIKISVFITILNNTQWHWRFFYTKIMKYFSPHENQWLIKIYFLYKLYF